MIEGSVNCLSINPIFPAESVFLNCNNIYKYDLKALPKEICDINDIFKINDEIVNITYSGELYCYYISVDNKLFTYNENELTAKLLHTFPYQITKIYITILYTYFILEILFNLLY